MHFYMKGGQHYYQDRIKLLAYGPLICINVSIKYSFTKLTVCLIPHHTVPAKHLPTIGSCVFGTENNFTDNFLCFAKLTTQTNTHLNKFIS